MPSERRDGGSSTGGAPRGDPGSVCPVTFSDPLDPLVPRLRDGDREALAEVYRVVGPQLLAWMRTQVRYGEVADDLVETTFVELIHACATFTGDGRSLRAWLFRAGRNNLIDWRRRAERRADHELDDQLADSLEDTLPSPEARVVQADAVDEVLDAMNELSPDQQEILRLRLLGQLSAAEVGELTGRSEGAVRALQHRGLRSLARVLEARRAADARGP